MTPLSKKTCFFSYKAIPILADTIPFLYIPFIFPLFSFSPFFPFSFLCSPLPPSTGQVNNAFSGSDRAYVSFAWADGMNISKYQHRLIRLAFHQVLTGTIFYFINCNLANRNYYSSYFSRNLSIVFNMDFRD